MDKVGQQYASQHKGSGGNTNLPFETDDFCDTTFDRQSGRNPSFCAALDDHTLVKSFLSEPFRRFSCASARAADEIDRLAFAQPTRIKKHPGLQSSEWFVAGVG